MIILNMMIKKNESETDRAIRIALGGILLFLWVLYPFWWLLVLSIVLFITGAVGFCSLYAIFGYSSCPIKTSSKQKKSSKKGK